MRQTPPRKTVETKRPAFNRLRQKVIHRILDPDKTSYYAKHVKIVF